MCHFVTYWDEGNEGRAESGGARPPIISEVDRPDRPRRSRPRRSRSRRSRPCRSRNICRVRWQRILSLSRIYACVRHGERVALTPPNGESGKGVNEGRRAADAFEKRAHIPTVCRRSLPGRPQCTDRRSGRPLRPETVRTCVANGGDRTANGPNPRVPCREAEARGATKPYGISMDKARTPTRHPAGPVPGRVPRVRGGTSFRSFERTRWKDEC
jgi:hypothetical protein